MQRLVDRLSGAGDPRAGPKPGGRERVVGPRRCELEVSTMGFSCAKWLDAVCRVNIKSAERRAPSAERHDCASAAGATPPSIAV